MLAALGTAERRRLVTAMKSIERLLSSRADGAAAADGPRSRLVLREARAGDLGWIVHRHGSLYAAEYGVDVVPWTYVVTTNAEGFRPNSAGPPYEIVLVGDSFLTAGEDDASTLSERLRAVSGRATFNLARAWYGPYQSLELRKRSGLALRPQGEP